VPSDDSVTSSSSTVVVRKIVLLEKIAGVNYVPVFVQDEKIVEVAFEEFIEILKPDHLNLLSAFLMSSP
jgi:hypothetical protein